MSAPTMAPLPRVDMSESQRNRLLSAAAALVRAAVAAQAPPGDTGLGDLADVTVGGVFVSLKRGRHLRGCCGRVGAPASVAEALKHAAYRTAWEDPRFPPVSPREVDQLQLEVWLLSGPEQVVARGEERLAAVEVGRHGVQVARGQAHGLFLPSVATEASWDARRLLEQVCRKAGLAPSAWRDDETALFTFEGESVRGTVADGERAPLPPRPWVCRPEDLRTYADFCRANLAAHLTGATPSSYLFGTPDGHVAGVVLTLQRPDTTEVRHFSQFSLRPGLPLQATLFGLTEAAARYLAEEGLGQGTLSPIPVGVTLLDDPAMHGTVAEAHLEGVDPRTRAVLVTERQRSVLLYDPDRPAEVLLVEAAAQVASGGCQPPVATAGVYSLEVMSAVGRLSVTTAARATAGPRVRPAAVAGTFYEADPEALGRVVDRLTEAERGQESWPAALVPHAGLRYSGAVAAAVLRRLAYPGLVIVLGPKHTNLGVEWAVAPHEAWALPGGRVESDVAVARELCRAVPGLEMDAAAHQREHAVEVELPLLARLAPGSRVVGLVIGGGDLASCRSFAEGLAGWIRGQSEKPLLLVSSDMNHFATDVENRRLDAMAIEALSACDPERLYHTVRDHDISMCGLLPAVIVQETLRLLGGCERVEQVAYATSGDVSGDRSRVVGYAGLLMR